jgi:integrase
MAKTLNKLSPLTIKSMVSMAKKEGNATKIPDGGGLYFVAEPERSSWWRFDYRFEGKQKTLSIGSYPEISLVDARNKRTKLREQVANAIDPSQQRKAERVSQSGANSFESIAREWWVHTKDKWTEGHAQRTLTRLINDVFPYVGSMPINDITAVVLLGTIRQIESRRAIESARRTNQACDGVFAYGIGTGRCENNPATAIRSVLKPAPPQKNFARLKETSDISLLLKTIEEYKGSAIVRAALQLLPLTFVRPGELAKLECSDIDFNKALWTVPAHVKKQSAALKNNPDRVHLVPLSQQAITILKNIYQLTGNGRYVFTGLRTSSSSQYERHMAMEALLGALRRMGYSKEEMTAHGFRGIASTRIREIGKGKFREEVIETQLAHTVKSKTQGAYDHSEYLDERRDLMQWWSDHIDNLKNS